MEDQSIAALNLIKRRGRPGEGTLISRQTTCTHVAEYQAGQEEGGNQYRKEFPGGQTNVLLVVVVGRKHTGLKRTFASNAAVISNDTAALDAG